ncbi:MAG: ABC transporter substrate-binding protein [Rhodocyclaceae bacterium]|nr:ABC transporter substrate-binding protein [Rhodocyclaceae bacterium]
MSDWLDDAWSRRRFLKCAAGAGAAALLAGHPESAAAEGPPETPSIRIHDAPITCFAPSYVAGELLSLEGFEDVQYVKTPLNEGPTESLAQGKVDFIMNDPPAHLLSLDAGAQITLLAGIHTGCWELIGNDSVRTLRDLKGKKVAAPQKSSREAFVAAMVASVGLDPNKDIIWINHEPRVSMKLFAEGKIDAFMGFAPEPQELRSRGIGHVILNTLTDRPWSQYFCCLSAVNTAYMRKYPRATKRAVRAFLKAAEICVNEPERAARIMVERGVSEKYEYVLQSVQEIGYRNWRIYDSEDTMRFWALRLREAGQISLSPKKVIEEHCDWRFVTELKRELKA